VGSSSSWTGARRSPRPAVCRRGRPGWAGRRPGSPAPLGAPRGSPDLPSWGPRHTRPAPASQRSGGMPMSCAAHSTLRAVPSESVTMAHTIRARARGDVGASHLSRAPRALVLRSCWPVRGKWTAAFNARVLAHQPPTWTQPQPPSRRWRCGVAGQLLEDDRPQQSAECPSGLRGRWRMGHTRSTSRASPGSADATASIALASATGDMRFNPRAGSDDRCAGFRPRGLPTPSLRKRTTQSGARRSPPARVVSPVAPRRRGPRGARPRAAPPAPCEP
jgi:hypothetical protein